MSEPPPDPFGPLHAGAVAALEMLRAYRRAGAGWLEAAFLVAAQITVGGAADGGQQGGAA